MSTKALFAVHLAGEHALELELVDARRVLLDVGDHGIGRVLVVLALGQVEQLARAGQALDEVADAVDGLVEQRALAAEGLRALGFVPDVRVLELAADFFQALALGVVVKDTPVATTAVLAGRRCAGGLG